MSTVIFCAAASQMGSQGLFPKHTDVGITPKKGKVKHDRKKAEYTVTGGGANVWAKSDAFQFVYQQISGDIMMSADVRFVGQGVEHHRKAALMIRQSLDSDSAYADVALHGDGLTSLQYRETKGGETKEVRSDVNAPVTLWIERKGNQFTISEGKEGGAPTKTGPVTIELHDPVYIGLAVCSHNADVLESAVFSNVRIEPINKSANTWPATSKRLAFLSYAK